ncbi:MAG TPA: hypothetical protein VGY31_09885 [Terriglobia bacterium]|nr:hypothetical protein [Terriglobia bacterium]
MYICKRQCGELSHFWEKLQSQAQAVATVNSILIDRGPAQGTHGQEKTALATTAIRSAAGDAAAAT